MVTAGQPRIVGNDHVAGFERFGRVLGQHVHDAARHRVDMPRRASDCLRQHIAARIEDARGEIAAFLISGDTSPDRIREVRSSGLQLLHKPVTPMALRAMLVRYLKIGRVSIAPDMRSRQLTV